MKIRLLFLCLSVALAPAASAAAAAYDIVIRGGTVYDGGGGPPYHADIAIEGDVIAAIAPDLEGGAGTVIDARGLAVAPGFINMLSWAVDSLIQDGRGISDIRQGVTLEVFGEGTSMGPVNEAYRAVLERRQGDFEYDIGWDSLAGYLEFLEQRGVSPNVASFVGHATVRFHAMGFDFRAPTDAELAEMCSLVRTAMRQGAMGVGSSLIYGSSVSSTTEELTALARVVAEHGGMYISHIRSEGDRLIEAVAELITIARESGARAEIYHLKAAGRENWGKLERVIDMIEAARADGLAITADMYTYTAGSTGFDAAMPPWVQRGGFEAWRERLADPDVRARVAAEMRRKGDGWENLYYHAGADGILLAGFENPELRQYVGKTLAEVAALRGTTPEETAMDLVVLDGSRVQVIYFLMSEANVRRILALPWVSFGSDAAAMAAEGTFLNQNPHPRAYGNFARVLGRYVRDEHVIPLAEAVRKLTSLPADNLGLSRRGRLIAGHHADIVVFDPATVTDHATFAEPHQYATGVRHVLVNGVPVLRDGEHTGATPGRFVRGPGYVPPEA